MNWYSALKLTIAQYLTPGDISIQSVGIEPDVELIPASINDERIHLFVNDEHPREKDLDKHLKFENLIKNHYHYLILNYPIQQNL